jgi:hypothetical protein
MRIDTIADVYIAHLVESEIISQEIGERIATSAVSLGFAREGFIKERGQTVYELPLMDNSDRAIEMIMTIADISRDYIFIKGDSVFIGYKARILR